MKIAHALQTHLLQQGGVEVLVRTLIKDTSLEDELILASQDDPSELATSDFWPRIQAHLQVPEGPLPESWGRTMARWMVAQGADICHFHLSGTYGWRSSRWKGCPIRNVAEGGIPTVTTNHQAISFFDHARPASPFWRKCAGTVAYWPGKMAQLSAVEWEASVSQHDLAASRRSFPGLGHKMIQVYHSRLDASLPASSAPSSKTILNVATIAFRKGQHILVEAFASIASDFPDWRLQIVGNPSEKACIEQIRAIIHRAGIEQQVDLIGSVSDPTQYFQECEIYVQPSLLEGLGLSLQEAMFHGRACIGSACGGIPELIENPTQGMLYPPGDVISLAAKLARLMGNTEERLHLGNAARTSILNRGMTSQAMAATYHTLYQKAISSR